MPVHYAVKTLAAVKLPLHPFKKYSKNDLDAPSMRQISPSRSNFYPRLQSMMNEKFGRAHFRLTGRDSTLKEIPAN